MDHLSGSVERVTYYNPENGYSVLRLRPEQRQLPGLNREGLVTVTGNLPELTNGEYLRLQGQWSNHPKHGMQFLVEVCEQIMPATVLGMRRYLSSGLIQGIGKRLADRIVDWFGAQTLEVIEHHPERLMEVPDIGPKRSRQITLAWQKHKQVKEIMLFLHSHGVSTSLAVKIHKQYGDQAMQVVQSDPYRLARDIFGVGFKTADRIAQSLGLPSDHSSRLEAGIIYILAELNSEGHVYSPQPELLAQTTRLLGVSPDLLPATLERLVKDQRVYADRLEIPAVVSGADTTPQVSSPQSIQAIYLTSFYNSEVSVAERLRSLAFHIPSNLSDLPPAFTVIDPGLSPEQQSAIKTALTHPLSVLTGGPGTGKTTCIKALIAALETAHKKYALASPTGRAAKRLSEASGRPASTIHRLLGFLPGAGFIHNADNPLPIDLLVVDETSMLDLQLCSHLLRALTPGTHLLLVGDVDQLPSVGAGDVLRDIIDSGIAPLTRLSLIFRQSANSQIIANAHRINTGQMPTFGKPIVEAGDMQEDFFIFPAETAEEAANWVQQVVCTRIPAKFGLHPRDQVQVLSPMYRGPAGVTALNDRLQGVLNPPAPLKPEKAFSGRVFRVGDKVMQIQNNYEKDVFNGDIGLIAGLDLIEHTLTIEFDHRVVSYDWSEVDQIVLAYAVSVHKSQGGEFPAVVIPMVTAHYMMLQRNLLYTAITRAKQLCVLVGSRKALGIAVRNDKVNRRYSALSWRLSK